MPKEIAPMFKIASSLPPDNQPPRPGVDRSKCLPEIPSARRDREQLGRSAPTPERIKHSHPYSPEKCVEGAFRELRLCM